MKGHTRGALLCGALGDGLMVPPFSDAQGALLAATRSAAPTMPSISGSDMSTVPDYRRRRWRFSFAQARAAGNAHCDESCT